MGRGTRHRGQAARARLRTVGQLALLGQEPLVGMLGPGAGRHLHALAHCHDPRPVARRRGRRSFGSQCALGSRPTSAETLDATVVALVDRVTRRMRTAGRAGRTVVVRLRYGDYSRASRSRSLPRATASTPAVVAVVRELVEGARASIEGRGLTLVGVAVSNLAPEGAGIQLELPLSGPDLDPLDHVLDRVRERFGPTAVTRATLVQRSPGLAPWLFPDEGTDP